MKVNNITNTGSRDSWLRMRQRGRFERNACLWCMYVYVQVYVQVCVHEECNVESLVACGSSKQRCQKGPRHYFPLRVGMMYAPRSG